MNIERAMSVSLATKDLGVWKHISVNGHETRHPMLTCSRKKKASIAGQ